MNQEKIIVIDFGGQYNQLVARRVRECHVYCDLLLPDSDRTDQGYESERNHLNRRSEQRL